MWLLDKNITFLNHGSFGACPEAILSKQQEYRTRLEKEPVSFIIRKLDELIWQSKQALGGFVNCNPEDLAFVPNVTHGVNTVMKSLFFQPGDEIITTNHIYNACRITIDYVSRRSGSIVKEIPIEFPLTSANDITACVLQSVTSKTKLVFIDHITSPTALIFPVKEIVKELEKKGIDCFVDGAHAPGGIPLDIEDIGAAYYTGNCHKWMCAPKGVGFLHVRKDRQKEIHPLAHSHFSADARSFTDRFHWSGTLDPTAALCIPEVITYFNAQFPGGWEELMQRNHDLIVKARTHICNAFQIPLPCPNEMIPTMAAIPFGVSKGSIKPHYNEIDELQELLFREYYIEIPVFTWPDLKKRIIRPSAQQYNSFGQYEYLVEAVGNLL